MTIELANCEETLMREIAMPEATERDVAQTYALTLKSSECQSVDWARVNGAIIERWSKTALLQVKKSAWSGECFDETRKR